MRSDAPVVDARVSGAAAATHFAAPAQQLQLQKFSAVLAKVKALLR